ncbi:hypothetical protein D3C79_794080 [compost metagenome]
MFIEEAGCRFAAHINLLITTLGHQCINALLVSANHLLIIGARLDRRIGLPPFKAHALLSEGGGDVLKVGQDLVGNIRGGLVVNGQAAHQRQFLWLGFFHSGRNDNGCSQRCDAGNTKGGSGAQQVPAVAGI